MLPSGSPVFSIPDLAGCAAHTVVVLLALSVFVEFGGVPLLLQR